MWVDKGKTVLLNFLVVTSLILSWLLVNSQPKYEYLHPAEYVEPLPVGEKKELRQLVHPKSIILHYGDESYTGVTKDSTHYRVIANEMEKLYFYDLAPIELSDEQWKEIVQQKKAIEVNYATEIPMDMMEELFTFRGKVGNMLSAAKRIIIYVDDSDKEAYALFMDQAGERMIQARTTITPRDLDEIYLSLQNPLEETTVIPTELGNSRSLIYLPKAGMTMKEYRYFYQPVPISQMLQVLFVDPSVTRQVTERNGTTIYTDGSKAVQLPPGYPSIHFYDPIAESLSSSSKDSHYHSVVNFVNDHGGWNGLYMLEALKRPSNQAEETYLFRQYVGAYPVYAAQSETYAGAIEVVSNQSYIVEFHRSLLNLDTYFDHKDVTIMSGEELLTQLGELGLSLNQVKDMYLGYEARVNDHHLLLTPKWIVESEGKDPLFLDARSAKKEGADGLEKSQNVTDPSVPASG